jgi:hypothetical protein
MPVSHRNLSHLLTKMEEKLRTMLDMQTKLSLYQLQREILKMASFQLLTEKLMLLQKLKLYSKMEPQTLRLQTASGVTHGLVQ